MTRRTDQLKLGAFLANSGHHVAAWRHPLSQADASLDFDHINVRGSKCSARAVRLSAS